MTHRKRRSYDHRIKVQTAAAGDPNLFPELEIPRSTAMSWIRRGVEMYFGRGEAVPDELAKKRREARTRRVEENHKLACSNCPRGSAIVSEDKAAQRVARIEGGIAADTIASSELRNVQRRSCDTCFKQRPAK